MNDSAPRRSPTVAVIPLGVAVATFAALFAYALSQGMRHTHEIVYSLDDPYIHLAIARHLASGGGFSFDGQSFSSASSSPLWVLALAGCMRLGIAAELAPLVLVGLSGVALLGVSFVALRRAGLGVGATTLSLVAEIVLAPLVPVASTGLEHLLHAAFAVALLDWFARTLDAPREGASGPRPSRLAFGVLVAALGTATRFEMAFEVAAVSMGLAMGRRWRDAIAVGVAGGAPIVAYGCVALAHGAPFLPYSVLLKASLPRASAASALKLFGITAYRTLAATPHVLVLVLAMLAAWLLLARREGRPRAPEAAWLGGALVTTALHLQFAKTGWFYRYECYLMVLGGLALACSVPRLRVSLGEFVGGERPGFRLRAVALALVLVASAPVVPRAIAAHLETPRAMRNIHEQQRQMARFFRTAFARRAVVVNDVGWVGFAGRVRVVDLMGLVTDEVARARLRRAFDTATIRRVASDAEARVAAVYPERFVDGAALPSEWIRVGAWTISDNVACGGPTVAFYGVDAPAAQELSEALAAFAESLPHGVVSEVDHPGR